MIRRLLGTAATTFLVVAAVVLAFWFVFSHLTGAVLVSFRTGSMAPTMPQGSVAIALPVNAADIDVGDVVTVRRIDEDLPVTHRVVEVRTPAEAASSTPIPTDARELVLRGDDNSQNDFLPYVVRDAKRVVFAVPWAGTWLTVLQSPLGIGLLVLGAGALTTWAFWPSRPRTNAEEGPSRESETGAAEHGVDGLPHLAPISVRRVGAEGNAP